MANVVFSEVLCFIKNNFDKLTADDIKPVLCSFYDFDDLHAAKESLVKTVQQALRASGDDTLLPRLPKRQNDFKSKQTADDLLKLFAVIDERKLGDVLPRFVAEDLSRIPFVNADSVNILAMAKKLENMEMRLNSVECFLSSNCIRDKDNCHQEDTDTIIPQSALDDLCALEKRADTAAAFVDGTRGVSSGQSDSDSEGSWTAVARRGLPKAAQLVNSRTTSTQLRQDTQQNNTRKQKILGMRKENDTTVKSGVKIIQKAVVHIDNLHPDCTQALLTDYLIAAGVEVLSCYSAKSWLRSDEKEQVTAFRVCVPAAKRHMLFDPQLWSEGVVIRDWKFRNRDNASTVQNKPPRHGTGVRS